MHGSGTGTEGDHFGLTQPSPKGKGFRISYRLVGPLSFRRGLGRGYKPFEVFLKPIHIWAKRHNPILVKCLLYKVYLLATHVGKAQ
jgi:hypothetical protein